jgi:hypothetical protein
MTKKNTSKPKGGLTDHSKIGSADEVARRAGEAHKGALLHQAGKKSRSAGLTGKKR